MEHSAAMARLLRQGTGALDEASLDLYGHAFVRDWLAALETGRAADFFAEWLSEDARWEIHPDWELAAGKATGPQGLVGRHDEMVESVLLGPGSSVAVVEAERTVAPAAQKVSIELALTVSHAAHDPFKAFHRWDITLDPANRRIASALHSPLRAPMQKPLTAPGLPLFAYPHDHEVTPLSSLDNPLTRTFTPLPSTSKVACSAGEVNRGPSFVLLSFAPHPVPAADGSHPVRKTLQSVHRWLKRTPAQARTEPPRAPANRKEQQQQCGGKAPCQPARWRPCEHNDWDSVRLKNVYTLLRCRACSAQWKVRSQALLRCQTFHQTSACPAGEACKLVHVHARKQSKALRQKNLLAKILQEEVGESDYGESD
ncbi:hypothetical protein DIPPA_27072 [Diplonema papillatum]|nr:hypothetical protein DIPPA_27072 [Diplonema papillatum]